MERRNRLSLDERKLSFLIFLIALGSRLFIWWKIPIDWNWDSYHHWQISYYTLKIGLKHLRLWDLNGCEYYWGVMPHITQTVLLSLFSTTSILPYRILNTILGCINSLLVKEIGATYYTRKIGTISGFIYAIFPVAAIFDVLALLDTLGLTFLLASLFLMRRKSFWSGVSLALAGQSRNEFLLVGFLIISVYAIREQLRTEILPSLFGWLTVTSIFGCHIYIATGNPFYPLYINLWNIFGGFNPVNKGVSFTHLMFKWATWKLSVWPYKLTGLIIILSMMSMIISFFQILRGKWMNYQPKLFFLTTLVIQLPTYITYFGSNTFNFLIMLRMITPSVALFCPLILNELEKISKSKKTWQLNSLCLIITLGILYSYSLLLPFYSSLQTGTINDFHVSEIVLNLYEYGTIVCDYPTMNYYLINSGKLNATNIISNHYSPDYYNVDNPTKYLHWLKDEEVSIWVYKDYRAEPVWNIINVYYPEILKLMYQDDFYQIFSVNITVIEKKLTSFG